MPTTVLSTLPGADFDAFLFATIGVERNGMLLSVLSALSRLDVDPWAEAASLANLPEKAATGKLTTLIASLPDGRVAPFDPGAIASRLIALLPRRVEYNVLSGETFKNMATSKNSKTIAEAFIIGVLFTSILLGLQFASRVDNKPAQADKAQPVGGDGEARVRNEVTSVKHD